MMTSIWAPAHPTRGKVSVIMGYWNGSERRGAVTRYEGFRGPDLRPFTVTGGDGRGEFGVSAWKPV